MRKEGKSVKDIAVVHLEWHLVYRNPDQTSHGKQAS